MQTAYVPKDTLEFKSMSTENKSPEVIIEIERVRRLSSHKKLAPFVRNQTTWELLLIISAFPNLQISEAIEKIKTRQLSHSSIVRFIQEQVSAGSFITSVAPKRSAKFLSLSAEVEKALQAFLQETYHSGQGSHSSVSRSNEPSSKTILCTLLVTSISLKAYKALACLTPLTL
jgi:hypothetical protein